MHKLVDFEGYEQAVFSLQASCAKFSRGYRLEYRLAGPLEQIVLPKKNEVPTFRNELWKHTCFEAFFQDASGHGYWEFNFSPSRDWAIYRFRSYRELDEVNLERMELLIQQERYPGELIMKIEVRPKDFFAVARVGLTAVLEHNDQRCSYWALHHAREKPDFHAPESFMINV